jgi:predicted RNA-binding Zn-ribbon protein involved in translation (DUF1610 family)
MLSLFALVFFCELKVFGAGVNDDPIDYPKIVGKYGVIAFGIFVYFVIRVLEKIKQNRTKAEPPPKDDSQLASDSRSENPVSTPLNEENEASNQSAGTQTPRREGAEVLFACRSCGQSIATDASSAGQQFSCPNCGEELVVPDV